MLTGKAFRGKDLSCHLYPGYFREISDHDHSCARTGDLFGPNSVYLCRKWR